MSGKVERVAAPKQGATQGGKTKHKKGAEAKPKPKSTAKSSPQVQTKPQVATKADLDKLSRRIDNTLLDLSNELKQVVKRLPKDSGEIITPELEHLTGYILIFPLTIRNPLTQTCHNWSSIRW